MRKVTSINGLPVLDAKAPLTLHILDKDCKNADNKNPADCVVARAIRRETRAIEARVHLGRVYVKTNKDHWTRYLTPKSMREEIIIFDRGGNFDPGEFELRAPPPSSLATGKRQGGPHKTRTAQQRRDVPKRPYRVVKNVRSEPIVV